jgi:hypothetical protein
MKRLTLGDYLLDTGNKSNYARRMNELLTWGLPIFAALALFALSYALLQVTSRSGD